MMIAQITDMHIKPEGVLAYGRFDTAPYLGRAVEHLLALKPRPDVVLCGTDPPNDPTNKMRRTFARFASSKIASPKARQRRLGSLPRKRARLAGSWR